MSRNCAFEEGCAVLSPDQVVGGKTLVAQENMSTSVHHSSPCPITIFSASVSTNETRPLSCVLCCLQHFPPLHHLWYANEEPQGFVWLKRLSTIPTSIQRLSLLWEAPLSRVPPHTFSVSLHVLKKGQLTIWLPDKWKEHKPGWTCTLKTAKWLMIV